MQQSALSNHKKISATITTLIISSILFSISFISVPSAKAWSSAQTAVSVFGGVGEDFSEAATLDSTGNIYTTGRFQSTFDFDPGAGTTNLTSAGGSDVFISKLDPQGNLVWAKGFGGSSSDVGTSIAVDSSGNVYTTGHFYETVDFDPGAGTSNLTSAGQSDVFVSKLDPLGNLLWAKRFGGSGAAVDAGYSIAVDSTGNVYTTGRFEGTVDFDPGAGTTDLASAGGHDVFVSKLDPSGNLLWAKTFGGRGAATDDSGFSIAVDSTGNVYTTGYFQGTADFDPGAGTSDLTVSGGTDIFISKLDSLGNLVFVKRFAGSSDDYGRSIALDSTGNIYTTGHFQSTVDFDPDLARTSNLTAAGGAFGQDIFVSKLDSSGNLVFAKRFGGTGDDFGYSIAVDSTGNVYTTGNFSGTADFDPSDGTSNLTSVGQADVFVSKLDPSGNLLLAKSFGGSANIDLGTSIEVDSNGYIYTTGYFAGRVDFDPSDGGITNLTAVGGFDIFVLRLDPSGGAQASAAPSAPALNSLTGGDRRVTITFTAGANNGAAITNYEYSLNGGAFTSAGTTSSPFTITGLSGRTAYSVTLKARNSVGLSTASNSLSATTTDASLDASEAAVEAARLAAIELARVSAASEAARKAKELRELTEILALIPKIGELTLSLGENTKSLYSTKCVKGKKTKYVEKGSKCPKGFVKKK